MDHKNPSSSPTSHRNITIAVVTFTVFTPSPIGDTHLGGDDFDTVRTFHGYLKIYESRIRHSSIHVNIFLFEPGIAYSVVCFLAKKAAYATPTSMNMLSGETKTITYLDAEQEMVLPEIGYHFLTLMNMAISAAKPGQKVASLILIFCATFEIHPCNNRLNASSEALDEKSVLEGIESLPASHQFERGAEEIPITHDLSSFDRFETACKDEASGDIAGEDFNLTSGTESCSTTKHNEQQSRYPEKETKLMHSNDEIRSFNPKRKATKEKVCFPMSLYGYFCHYGCIRIEFIIDEVV
ncbi:hypothetical protein Tco_1256509 [Tanacetum coccineum]